MDAKNELHPTLSQASQLNPAEEYLTLAQASQLIPGHPHVSAPWRWHRKGVKVHGREQRIRLRCVRAGSRLLTTKTWLNQFMAELAAADLVHFEQPPSTPSASAPTKGKRSPEQRNRAAAAARAKAAGK